MRKLIVGFILGSLTTSVLFLILDQRPGAVPALPDESVQLSSVRTGLDDALAEDAQGIPEGSETTAPGASSTATRTPDPRASANEAALSEAALSAKSAQEYFERLLEMRGIESREAMESEPIDPNWAPNAEAQFANCVAQKAELNQYGSPQVNCRSTMCEVKLLAYGANDVTSEEWYQFLQTGVNEYPWAESWELAGFNTEDENGGTRVSWQFRSHGPADTTSRQFVFRLN